VEECKKAETTKRKDEALLNKIALQQTERSLAFRVVNRDDGRVEKAAYLLSLWSGASSKTEAERKERTKKIDEEITEKNIKRAGNDKVIRELKKKRGGNN